MMHTRALFYLKKLVFLIVLFVPVIMQTMEKKLRKRRIQKTVTGPSALESMDKKSALQDTTAIENTVVYKTLDCCFYYTQKYGKPCFNCCLPCLEASWNCTKYLRAKLPPCKCPRIKDCHGFKDEAEVKSFLYKFFGIGILTCITCRGIVEIIDYYD